jgi:hypothetical protein
MTTETSLPPDAQLRADLTDWAIANGGIQVLASKADVPVEDIRRFLAGERLYWTALAKLAAAVRDGGSS